VVVEKNIEAYKPKDVLGLDVNYANLTFSNGAKIPVKEFGRALAFRAKAETTQRRYSKKWRYVKDIRQAVSRFNLRAGNVIRDVVNQLANRAVAIASNGSFALAMEDLKHLNQSSGNSPKIRGQGLPYGLTRSF
jgi:hypothetical protein